MNPAFATPSRNKRGLAADLSQPAGQELVRRLLPQIDVIVENNATGVMDRLGLGWETVSAINPRLIMVGTQLYGDRGPWAAKKGYGPSARAIGGLTWLWAHGPDAPRGVMTIHPDHLAGRLVALGALAALHARDRTGHGYRLDLAQFEAVSALLGDLLLGESLQPGFAQPVGNRSTSMRRGISFAARMTPPGASVGWPSAYRMTATWSAFLAGRARRVRPSGVAHGGGTLAGGRAPRRRRRRMASRVKPVPSSKPGFRRRGCRPARPSSPEPRPSIFTSSGGATRYPSISPARARCSLKGRPSSPRHRHPPLRSRASAGSAHRGDLPRSARPQRRRDRATRRGRRHRRRSPRRQKISCSTV